MNLRHLSKNYLKKLSKTKLSSSGVTLTLSFRVVHLSQANK